MASPSPLSLSFPDKAAPLGPLLIASLAGIELDAKVDPAAAKGAEPVLKLGTGDALVGATPAARYLARLAPPSLSLYGDGSPLQAVNVDTWLDWAGAALKPGPGLEAAVATLDAALALRTVLVGSSLTAADYAVWGALQAIGQWTKLRKAAPHAARWHAHVAAAAPAGPALADAHGLSFRPPGERAAARAAAGLGGGDTGSFDVALPGAKEGAVTTRFPPEPSGYLHIGHAKAALLNDFFAKHYKGRLIVRFDDTNPAKESTEFRDSIIEDLKTLGVEWAGGEGAITYTSDYFPQMLELGERLIRAGHLYADDTPVDRMREERMAGKESACRGRSVEENLALWEEMKAGTPTGLKNCMRFKMDMASANATLRDPVAYRCNVDTPHWRTGTTYKVYPTYDCACPFVDALEGVTHALRTSEYRDRAAQFEGVLKMCQSVWGAAAGKAPLPDVAIWDYSRLAFSGTVMSKRKLLWFVETGHVEGWDDPRFPTVRGVIRRGLQVSALRSFILAQGASRAVTLQDMDKLWAANRAVVDPLARRHTAIREGEAGAAPRVKLALAGGPASPETVDAPAHKKNPALGTKAQTRAADVWLEQADAAGIADGEEVTLMDWGNAVVESVSRDAATGVVTGATGRLHLEGSPKATRLKLTWLPAHADAPLTPLTLVEYGDLLTKKKLEEGEDVADFVNPASKSVGRAVGDAGLAALPAGALVQLERVGFYRVDVAGPAPTLIRIPDGKKGGGGGGEAAAAKAGAKAA